MLPINTVVQLELFEPEPLDTGNKKPSTFSCFDRWKREALIQEHRHIRDAICRRADAYEQNKLILLTNLTNPRKAIAKFESSMFKNDLN